MVLTYYKKRKHNEMIINKASALTKIFSYLHFSTAPIMTFKGQLFKGKLIGFWLSDWIKS